MGMLHSQLAGAAEHVPQAVYSRSRWGARGGLGGVGSASRCGHGKGLLCSLLGTAARRWRQPIFHCVVALIALAVYAAVDASLHGPHTQVGCMVGTTITWCRQICLMHAWRGRSYLEALAVLLFAVALLAVATPLVQPVGDGALRGGLLLDLLLKGLRVALSHLLPHADHQLPAHGCFRI